MPPIRFLLAIAGLVIFNLAFTLEYLMFTNLPGPIEIMFNQSFHSHYGSYLDALGISTIWSFSAFTQRFGELIGIFLLFLIDNRGRKFGAVYLRYMMIMSSGSLLLLAFFLPSFECFMLACAFNGAGVQVKIGATGMYVSECAPTKYRGFGAVMVAFGETMVTIVAYTLYRPSFFGNSTSWFMFPVFSLLLSSIITIFLHFLPESPQFLVDKGDFIGAEKSLKFYNEKETDTEQMMVSIQKQQHGTILEKKESYMTILRNEAHFKTLRLLISMLLFIDVSAISIELMFFVRLHTMLGFTSETIMTIATIQRIIILPFVFFTAVAIEKLGRRPIALIGYTLIFLKGVLILNGVTISFFNGPSLITQLIAITSDFFSSTVGVLGMAQMKVLLLCELTPPSCRVSMMQLTASTSMVAGIIFASFVPFAFTYFPPLPYVFLVVVQTFLIYHIYRNLPETAGREMYEIVDDFEEAVRSRTPTRLTTTHDDESRPLLVN